MPKYTKPMKRRGMKVADKDILKFFPKPYRMGQPVPTQWEKPSTFHVDPKNRQALRNSY
jgi:hypothetical protein